MLSACRAIRPLLHVLLLSACMAAPARAQATGPRPHALRKAPSVNHDQPTPFTPVQTVWGLSLNNALTAAPAYEGTQGFFSIEGDRIVAYELTTGVQQWTISARPARDPVAGGGLIFFLESGALKALHTVDGSLAWVLPFADPLAVNPVWDNGWLVVAMANGEVRALRATDGQLIWTRDLKSRAHALPALAADRVYVPMTDGRIVALRIETGDPLWERRLSSAPNEILALDERLYVGTSHFFYCILAADGKIDWPWRTGGDVVGRPVADDRYVYFVALDNVLRAMNLVSGGQQWMRPLPMRPAWGPVKAGTTILVGGDTPPLNAYNSKDGVAAGTMTGVVVPQPPAPVADAAGTGGAEKKAPVAFLALAPEAKLATAPHVLVDPLTHGPLLLMVFYEIARGASATLVTHSVEPPLIDRVAALPNLIQIAPVTPTTPPPRP